MRTFTEYLNEIDTKNLKKFLTIELTKDNLKAKNSSRGTLHLRAFVPKPSEWFKKRGCTVNNSSEIISAKYTTYELITTKEIKYMVSKKEIVIPKKTKLFFVDTNISKTGIVRDKQLTPDSLGFAGKTYTIKELKKELDEVVKLQDASIQKTLQSIINSSYNNKNELFIGSSTPADIRIIIKDFGELTGALWSMKHYYKDAVSVEFPLESNYPLVDYFIYLKNGERINVSAKSGGGASPSTKNIYDILANNKIDISSDEIEARDFFMDITELSNLDTVIKYMKIFEIEGYSILKDIIDNNNLNINLDDPKQMEKDMENMDWNTVKELFSPLWTTIKAGPSKKMEEKDYNKLKKKSGVLLSPLGSHLVKVVNNNEKILAVLNRALNSMSVDQLYLTTNKDSLKYEFKTFKTLKFNLSWGGSVPNPSMVKIKFKPTK